MFKQVALKPADVMHASIAAIARAARVVPHLYAFDIVAHAIATTDRTVFVTGIGKSGVVARKIAATLATCRIRAVFADPGALWHGELGSIESDDIVIMVSHSGETDELLRLVPILEKKRCMIAPIVGYPLSTLGKMLCSIATGIVDEPFAQIPTASAAAATAVGDALAVTVAQLKGLDDVSLAPEHPGGTIGQTNGRLGPR
jgi:arabinose-5-phosphate isomerase